MDAGTANAAAGILRCAVVGLLAAASLATPATAANRPYALRGIALGITLQQFRATPYPDHARNAAARIVCSSDPTAAGLDALHLTPSLVEADVVKCGYFQPGFGGGTAPRIAAPVEFLGDEVTPLFLFYRQPGAKLHRLAQITFAMGTRSTDEVTGLFRRAFGKMPELQVASVQTGFGPQLADVIYIWKNGASTIRLDTITVVLNEMSVVFLDDHLGASLDNRLDSIARLNHLAAEELAKKEGEQIPSESRAAKAPASEPAKPGSAVASFHDLLAGESPESAAQGDTAADAGKGKDGKGKGGKGKNEEASRSATAPAVTTLPPLSDMAPPPGPAPDTGQADAAAPQPSYIEPPLNLPSSLGSFTFK